MRPLKVLFICVGNTCRSPMAEAMARTLGSGRLEAFSAGLSPTGRVAEESLAALRALGYRPDGLSSKSLDGVPVDHVDVAVSLIGPPGLRFLPHGFADRVEAWSIRDPYGDDDAVYLSVARTIESRVRELVEDLLRSELTDL